MIYSLNSLKGVIRGLYWGIIGVTKRDTRSLDFSSNEVPPVETEPLLFKFHVSFEEAGAWLNRSKGALYPLPTMCCYCGESSVNLYFQTPI